MKPGDLSRVVRLDAQHDVTQFSCGVVLLDEWLANRARRNEAGRGSRTYVVCSGDVVVAYYSLANGGIDRALVPKPMQRTMPNPVPVMLLGRLAVDHRFQWRGIGHGLLRDATLRTRAAAEIAGIKALVVDAISDDAKRFYEESGFVESLGDPMRLCLGLDTAEAMLGEVGPRA